MPRKNKNLAASETPVVMPWRASVDFCFVASSQEEAGYIVEAIHDGIEESGDFFVQGGVTERMRTEDVVSDSPLALLLASATSNSVASEISPSASNHTEDLNEQELGGDRSAVVSDGEGHDLCACGQTMVVCKKCGDSRCLSCDPYRNGENCADNLDGVTGTSSEDLRLVRLACQRLFRISTNRKGVVIASDAKKALSRVELALSEALKPVNERVEIALRHVEQNARREDFAWIREAVWRFWPNDIRSEEFIDAFEDARVLLGVGAEPLEQQENDGGSYFDTSVGAPEPQHRKEFGGCEAAKELSEYSACRQLGCLRQFNPRYTSRVAELEAAAREVNGLATGQLPRDLTDLTMRVVAIADVVGRVLAGGLPNSDGGDKVASEEDGK